jgi:hypothetical protein
MRPGALNFSKEGPTMNESLIDTMLRLFGNGPSAATHRPSAEQAVASGKAGKKGKKLARKRCQLQVGECQSVLPGLCAGDQVCLGSLICCDFFGECNTTAALACFANGGV